MIAKNMISATSHEKCLGWKLVLVLAARRNSKEVTLLSFSPKHIFSCIQIALENKQ